MEVVLVFLVLNWVLKIGIEIVVGLEFDSNSEGLEIEPCVRRNFSVYTSKHTYNYHPIVL